MGNQRRPAPPHGRLTKILVGAQATRIYAEFTLPRVKVTGFTEEDGPGRWQSRFRGELMVNKHPVWASEAMRLTQLNQPAGQGIQLLPAIRDSPSLVDLRSNDGVERNR